MIFKQLFESSSSTYTYLISDPTTRDAVLIDPVRETVQRDMQILKELDLHLKATIETHVHADHLTGAKELRDHTGCKIAYPAMLQSSCADIGIKEHEAFNVGNIELHPLFTPGHTDHHYSYLIDTPIQQLIFTGDALLIEACGRTDFQSGDAETLFNSIHEKIFSLPDDTLVYPGHDYEGRFITTIAQEKIRNPRLGGGKTKEEFIKIMDGLNLPYPRKIQFAVPGNEKCGVCPDDIPEELKSKCKIHDQG